MASVSFDANGSCFIQFVTADRRRPTIRIGKRSRDAAEKIKTKIEALSSAKISGQPLDNATAKWVRGLAPTLYDKIAAAGLLTKRALAGQVTLAALLNDYIDNRYDVKPSTSILYGNARRNLIDKFGANRLIDSITPADADDWRRWLAKPKNADDPQAGGQDLAPETVRQRCRIAKQFFRDAARRKLIDESPFADMKGVSAKGNRDKDHFVTRDDAAKVLAACPDDEWRLIFALARFGGMRCPSEVLLLRWGDVNWDANRITVRSPKTEHHEGKDSRVMPLFPELRPYLESLWDVAPEGSEFVITRYRETEVNLRTRLRAIARAAGLKPWPKSFVALRSTRRTELQEQFADYVLNDWFGHSSRVAERHYLQVTDAHFEAAAKVSDPMISAQTKCSAALQHAPVLGSRDTASNRTTSQTTRILRRGTKRDGQGGRGRTRICDLLHVKQAL